LDECNLLVINLVMHVISTEDVQFLKTAAVSDRLDDVSYGFQRIVACGICVDVARMRVYGMVLDLRSRLSCNAKFSPKASFQGHIIHHSPKRVCSLNVLGCVSNVCYHVCRCVIL